MNSKFLLMFMLVSVNQSLIRVDKCQKSDPLDLKSYLTKRGLTVITFLDSQEKPKEPAPVEFRLGNEFTKFGHEAYVTLQNTNLDKLKNIYVGEAWIVKDGAKNYMVHVVPVGQLSDAFLTSRFSAGLSEIEGDFVECLTDGKQFIYRKEYRTISDECLGVKKNQEKYPEIIEEFKKNSISVENEKIFAELNLELVNYLGPKEKKVDIKPISKGSNTEIIQLNSMPKDLIFKKLNIDDLQLNEILTLKKLKTEPTGPGFKFCFYETDGENVYVVMEKMANDLDDPQYREKFKKSTAKDRFKELIKITEVFEKFHVSGSVHDDIKPGNIMVDAKGNFRVIDVGISVEEGALSLPATKNIFRPPGRGNRVPLKQTYDVQALSLAFCFLSVNAFEIKLQPVIGQSNSFLIDENGNPKPFILQKDFQKAMVAGLKAKKTPEDVRKELGFPYDMNGKEMAGGPIIVIKVPEVTIPKLFVDRVLELHRHIAEVQTLKEINADNDIVKNFLEKLREFWNEVKFPFAPSLETNKPLSPDAVLTWALIPEAQLPGALKVTMSILKKALVDKMALIDLIKI